MSRLPWVALGLCGPWAAAATWIAWSDHREVQRLNEAADIQRAAHEDKVRALTRRLVGVASHQMLEQDGLAGRLADIITRQVDLETRQAALSALADRAAVGPAGAPSLPADRGSGPGAKDAPGAPAGSPGRGTSLAPEPTPRPRSDLALPAVSGLPLRDQFGRIEASLARVADGQGRIVAALTAGARAGIERVRAVLADLRLALAPPASPRGPAAPAPQNAFAAQLAGAEAALAEAARWSALTDGVPLRAPIDGEGSLSSNFGTRKDPFTGAVRMHAGMDFRSAVGTPVRTAAAGRVVTAGTSGGYGNLVEIDHGHDIVTRYGHLSAIGVSVDQAVAAGTVVGLVGSTGRSTGPHLHYETRLSGSPVDPARFLTAGRTLFGRPAQAPETPAEPQAEAADAAD